MSDSSKLISFMCNGILMLKYLVHVYTYLIYESPQRLAAVINMLVFGYILSQRILVGVTLFLCVIHFFGSSQHILGDASIPRHL